MPTVAQIEKLLQAEPQDVFLNFSLAMALVKENRPEEALTQFDRVLQLDPEYVPAYFQKAHTLVRMQRAEDARRVLEAGIAAARRKGDRHAADEMLEMQTMLR